MNKSIHHESYYYNRQRQHKKYKDPPYCILAVSVLLQRPRSTREVYNDPDEEVVNFFKVIRHPRIARKLISRLEFEKAHTPASTAIERARRLTIRSFMVASGRFAKVPLVSCGR